jgi:hypothetical protein
MEIYDDNNYFQIVSGGGGSSEKQQLISHKLHPAIKFSLSEHGFAMHCNGQVKLFTKNGPKLTNSLELTYDKKAHAFIHAEENDNPLKTLRHCIQQACDTHIKALKEIEENKAKNLKTNGEENKTMASYIYTNFSFFYKKTETICRKLAKQAIKFAGRDVKTHMEKEIASIYGMMAYFNQTTLDLQKCLTYLTNWKDTYKTQSFYLILEDKLQMLDKEQFADVLEIFKNRANNYSSENNSENEGAANYNTSHHYDKAF